MSERLSDERLAQMRANYARYLEKGRNGPCFDRDIVSMIDELQDLRRYAATVKEWMLKPVKVET